MGHKRSTSLKNYHDKREIYDLREFPLQARDLPALRLPIRDERFKTIENTHVVGEIYRH